MKGLTCPRCGKKVVGEVRGTVIRRRGDSVMVKANACCGFELEISQLGISPGPLGCTVGDVVSLTNMTELGTS